MLDVDAFSARLTTAYPRLWLIAAAITNDRTEAEDIVQEAALVALRKLDEFTAGTNFSAWMSQIVRLTALNHVRKSHRQNTLPTDPTTLDRASQAPAQPPRPNQTVTADGRLVSGQQEFDDELCGALGNISEVARACLLLRTVQQLSYEEIAAALDIPSGTAMSHVHRARESLREQLQGRHGNDSASHSWHSST